MKIDNNNNLLTYGIIALVVYLFIQIQEKGIWGSILSLFGGKSADKDDKKIDVSIEYVGAAKSATISQAQAKFAASQLHDAMKGWTVDQDTVTAVWDGTIQNNPANLALVASAFGTEEIGSFGSPLWGDGVATDLRGWIKKRLEPIKVGYWEVLFNQIAS